jgi:hypothetical protein
MPSITDKRIFTKEWNEAQQRWFLVVDLSISIAKRRFDQPDAVHLPDRVKPARSG